MRRGLLRDIAIAALVCAFALGVVVVARWISQAELAECNARGGIYVSGECQIPARQP